mmetsp:Transcript_62880/g.153102  ORF Transcript_62880/g.153102 Transcript_62880/m.153102 type:complete len:559 (+) Transcript_62880:271-1947(+)
MLRPRVSPPNNNNNANIGGGIGVSGGMSMIMSTNNNEKLSSSPSSSSSSKYNKRMKLLSTNNVKGFVVIISVFLLGFIFGSNLKWLDPNNSNDNDSKNTSTNRDNSSSNSNMLREKNTKLIDRTRSSSSDTTEDDDDSMDAFRSLYRRSLTHRGTCHAVGLDDEELDTEQKNLNNHSAHLPQFGFLGAFEQYDNSDSSGGDGSSSSYPYECHLPPETECDEKQFTVIFMAYNPDRLQKMFSQIKKMLSGPDFGPLVAEVIVVWNGEREVEETPLGKTMVEYSQTHPLRISYPLKAGFPNDLLNRYHPRLDVKTKAIMYYDDDGPFYSFPATLGGFELWKRNSNAQIGAMARKLDLGPRQVEESKSILNGPGDRFFISQCPADSLDYNYREFANFGARMVLPSGSFLHSNYLCFLWHPIFEEIRQYVRKHPVNPDDGTVSTLVSQLAGRAPRVYPRRVNKNEDGDDNNASDKSKQRHRRLMDGIDWDKGGGHAKKMDWGRLRGDAANSLARYFGSINSGSIGWCYGTEYQKGEYCKPDMAKIGMLPWLKPDHTPRDTCP